jgi:formate dehydrogenase
MVAVHRQARGAALYSATGVNMGTNGSLAFWLQECINAISGNLDRKGGTLVSRGVIDFAKFSKKHGMLVQSNTSRIGSFTSVNDAFPGGILGNSRRRDNDTWSAADTSTLRHRWEPSHDHGELGPPA